MPVAGRGTSFATLGFLGVASAAFGLWSGLSGPRNADVQLQDAVTNTLASSGFVATLQPIDDRASTSPGSSSYSSTLDLGRAVLEYEAPDREVLSAEDSSGRTEERVTEIGSSCWVTGAPSGSGISVSPVCSADSIHMFLSSIRSLDAASHVRLESGTFVLSPTDSEKYAVASNSSSGGSSSAEYLAQAQVEIRLNGDFLASINMDIPDSFGVYVQFAEVGKPPPISQPSDAPTSVVG